MTCTAALNTAELDRRIKLQQPTGAPDEYGQPGTVYVDVATVWAAYKPVNLREYAASRQAEAAIDATFKIRWRTDLKATWRILYRDLVFDIQSYFEIGHAEGLEILARGREA
jgi:SPP1 family predicted phage head-tail adaptor